MEKFKYDNWAYNSTSAEEIVPLILEQFPAKKIVDIGCGRGEWLSVFKKSGVPYVFGLDGSSFDESSFSILREEYQQHDLCITIDLNKQFDLVLSLEVGEHLPENKSENFIDSLCNAGEIIVFSAAIPGQGGQHHINEQWPSYWVEKFRKRGFTAVDNFRPTIWNNHKIHWWYRQNILLFHKESVQSIDNSPLDIVHPDLFNHALSKIKLHESGTIGVKSALIFLINAIVFKLFKKPFFIKKNNSNLI